MSSLSSFLNLTVISIEFHKRKSFTTYFVSLKRIHFSRLLSFSIHKNFGFLVHVKIRVPLKYLEVMGCPSAEKNKRKSDLLIFIHNKIMFFAFQFKQLQIHAFLVIFTITLRYCCYIRKIPSGLNSIIDVKTFYVSTDLVIFKRKRVGL